MIALASMAIMSVRSVAENSLLQAMIHKAAFLLKLRFFHFLKLLLHNQALYRPMQRQVAQGELAPRAIHGNVRSILPSKEWTKWRKSLRVQGKTPQKASLTVVKQAASVRSAKQSQKAATACSSTSSRTPANGGRIILADVECALDPCVIAKNENSLECHCDFQLFVSLSVCHMSIDQLSYAP